MKSKPVIHSRIDDVICRMVYAQQCALLGAVPRLLLYLLGIDIPRAVVIGSELQLVHSTAGIVVHPQTVIGDRVTIFHGVTIGRADIWEPLRGRQSSQCVVEDDAVIGVGATILVKSDAKLTIGRGAVVGANSVVLKSIPAYEVWAGNPARKVSDRAVSDCGR